jgi:ABC-type phosphate transport system auxiliary subunit
MDRPLKEHIAHLEQRLEALNQELMESAPIAADHNRIESDIRAAELALVYYRQALELEKKVG